MLGVECGKGPEGFGEMPRVNELWDEIEGGNIG